jgi:hypothetical protein
MDDETRPGAPSSRAGVIPAGREAPNVLGAPVAWSIVGRAEQQGTVRPSTKGQLDGLVPVH